MAVTTALVATLLVGGAALFVLVRAAALVVARSLRLARHYDVSDALLGMTVVAVGTSLPELAAHITASVGILAGTFEYGVASATALGGNMGSSTAQQTLLFGVFLVGYGGVELPRSFLRENYLPMVAAILLTLAVAADGTVSRVDGLLLLVSYAAYTAYSISHRTRTPNLPRTESADVRRDVAVVVLGVAALFVSAFVVLDAVQTAVDGLRLGGSMVGVVTLGLAAALPELTTVAQSIRRRAPYVAVGTLVGSNVVNLLLGVGLGGTLSTYAVPPSVVVWDLPFKLVVAVGVYAASAARDRLTRRDGVSLVAAYFVFVSVRLLLFPGQ
ncbi:MAG: sodium:calcium antiporter [Haloplanus sp.]